MVASLGLLAGSAYGITNRKVRPRYLSISYLSFCIAHQKGLIVDAFKFPVLVLLDEIAHAFQEAPYSSLRGFSPRKRRRQASCVYRTLRDIGGTRIPSNRWQRGVERKRQTNQQSCDPSRVLPCYIPRGRESDTWVTGFDCSGPLVYWFIELFDLKYHSGAVTRSLSIRGRRVRGSFQLLRFDFYIGLCM